MEKLRAEKARRVLNKLVRGTDLLPSAFEAEVPHQASVAHSIDGSQPYEDVQLGQNHHEV